MMMGRGGGMVGGSSRCQDCGNQGKKDCVYMRCRTCCKNKGFQCETHVKSTWVPLYRRRQRQQQQQQQQQQQLPVPPVLDPQHLQVHHNPKRHRQFPSPGSKEGNHLPADVHAMASFCCIRVSSMGDEMEEYGYQTSVKIGGHVFRGILYDQGPENRYSAGEGSSLALQQPNLANAAAAHAPATTVSSNAETLSLPSSSPFHFNAFMPGTQFLPRPKS